MNNLKLARFREVFPAAKTDALDARKILELFHLKDHLPLAKDVLQEVPPVPAKNERLKRLARRRRQLVWEKVRVVNRMQSDLQALCPELLSITGSVDNLWFLRFVSSRDDLRKLARRFLELLREIAALDAAIKEISQESEMACQLDTIPCFGETASAELAGEIGTIDRFDSEASLALYVGMCPLDKQSGQSHRTRTPRNVNTRAKAALMTAVARHIEKVPQSRAYYERKRREGKKHNQAIRALGRHLARVMWATITQGRDYELRRHGPFENPSGFTSPKRSQERSGV